MIYLLLSEKKDFCYLSPREKSVSLNVLWFLYSPRFPSDSELLKLPTSRFSKMSFAEYIVCAPGMARSAVTGAVLQLWWLKND